MRIGISSIIILFLLSCGITYQHHVIYLDKNGIENNKRTVINTYVGETIVETDTFPAYTCAEYDAIPLPYYITIDTILWGPGTYYQIIEIDTVWIDTLKNK